MTHVLYDTYTDDTVNSIGQKEIGVYGTVISSTSILQKKVLTSQVAMVY